MLVRDLITAALRLISVIASGETPSGSESVDALFSLNRLTESLSSNIAYLYENKSATYTLPSAASTVTMGLTGDLAAPVDSYIDVVFVDAMLYDAADPVTARSNTVTYILQNSRPLNTLKFGKDLDAGTVVELYYRAPLAQYATLDDEVLVPTGYVNMYIYMLAKDLAPSYGKVFSDSLNDQMREFITTVKRKNSNSAGVTVDTRIDVAGNAGGFDIYAGT